MGIEPRTDERRENQKKKKKIIKVTINKRQAG